jgi:hypothetical protein
MQRIKPEDGDNVMTLPMMPQFNYYKDGCLNLLNDLVADGVELSDLLRELDDYFDFDKNLGAAGVDMAAEKMLRRQYIQHCVQILMACHPHSSIKNASAYQTSLVDDLADFTPDIVRATIIETRKTAKKLPSVATIYQTAQDIYCAREDFYEDVVDRIYRLKEEARERKEQLVKQRLAEIDKRRKLRALREDKKWRNRVWKRLYLVHQDLSKDLLLYRIEGFQFVLKHQDYGRCMQRHIHTKYLLQGLEHGERWADVCAFRAANLANANRDIETSDFDTLTYDACKAQADCEDAHVEF